MIIHNIAFKVGGDDPQVKEEQITEVSRRILDLEGKVSGLRSMSIGRDLGRVDGHFDIVLITTHDTYEDLESYQAHPLHADVIAYGKTIFVDRACVDYEVP